MRQAFVVILCLVLVGCHNAVEDMPTLIGLTDQQVKKKFGTPSFSHDMTLHQGETLPEMYIEVHNTYDPADPATEGVELRTLHWQRRSHTKVVIMHRVNGAWVVFDAFRFDNDVVF